MMASDLEGLLGATLSLVMCLVCTMLAVASFRRTREIFSPWTLFLAMAVGDIYLPGFLFFLNVLPARAPWIQPSADEMVVLATVFFTIGLVLFCVGYALTDGAMFKNSSNVRTWVRNRTHLSRIRLYIILVITGLIYGVRLASDVLSQGSIQLYVKNKLTNRFAAEALSGGGNFATVLSLSVLPIFFVMTAVAFSRRKSLLRGLTAPLLGLLAAATTLFRGYILSYFVGLTIIEAQRIREEMRRRTGSQRSSLQPRIWRIALLAFLGIFVFGLYGSARNLLTAKEYGIRLSLSEAVLYEVQQIARGEGLMGLATILDYYPRQDGFFNGKTIVDMLLLPVPRSVWHEKPQWYGIDDITRRMGWPHSTQSPVTMPGELYANFGYAGTLLMLLYGMIFGYLHRHRYGSRFRYVYAFVVVPGMLPVFWMGFTGFMNQLVPGLAVGVALWFIFPKSALASRAVLSPVPVRIP